MSVDAAQIKAVGKARRPEDLPRLVGWLRDADAPAARAQAAACLGWQRTPEALEPLADAAVADAEPDVRAAALRALGALKYPGAARVLGPALADSDALCRSLALRLAGMLGQRPAEVMAAVADDGAPPAVAMEACLAAGRLGDPAHAPALWTRHEAADDVSVRRAAAMAWCQLADDGERLRGLLTDADADLRVSAMGALERLGPPDAGALVAGLLDDPHPAVKRVAQAIHGRLTRRPAGSGDA